MVNGIINVHKEAGFTSHDVVAKLRGILKQKKIGHTGTLDPDATGVLPVCLGKATKLCDLLTDKDKTYEAVMLLGTVTDTQDTSGQVLEEKEVTSTEEEVRQVVMSYVGEYDQIPPMYSALKVNGKKLCDLAREGKEVERKPRRITIHSIDILHVDMEKKEVRMTVTCSKGTYIRTLCHDIGAQLGCGACMKQLIRTKVSRFDIKESLTLSEIDELNKAGQLGNYIVAIDEMFLHDNKIVVKEEFNRLLINGNSFTMEQIDVAHSVLEGKEFRVYDHNNQFVALYKLDGNRFKSVKMFI